MADMPPVFGSPWVEMERKLPCINDALNSARERGVESQMWTMSAMMNSFRSRKRKSRPGSSNTPLTQNPSPALQYRSSQPDQQSEHSHSSSTDFRTHSPGLSKNSLAILKSSGAGNDAKKNATQNFINSAPSRNRRLRRRLKESPGTPDTTGRSHYRRLTREFLDSSGLPDHLGNMLCPPSLSRSLPASPDSSAARRGILSGGWQPNAAPPPIPTHPTDRKRTVTPKIRKRVLPLVPTQTGGAENGKEGEPGVEQQRIAEKRPALETSKERTTRSDAGVAARRQVQQRKPAVRMDQGVKFLSHTLPNLHFNSTSRQQLYDHPGDYAYTGGSHIPSHAHARHVYNNVSQQSVPTPSPTGPPGSYQTQTSLPPPSSSHYQQQQFQNQHYVERQAGLGWPGGPSHPAAEAGAPPLPNSLQAVRGLHPSGGQMWPTPGMEMNPRNPGGGPGPGVGAMPYSRGGLPASSVTAPRRNENTSVNYGVRGAREVATMYHQHQHPREAVRLPNPQGRGEGVSVAGSGASGSSASIRANMAAQFMDPIGLMMNVMKNMPALIEQVRSLQKDVGLLMQANIELRQKAAASLGGERETQQQERREMKSIHAASSSTCTYANAAELKRKSDDVEVSCHQCKKLKTDMFSCTNLVTIKSRKAPRPCRKKYCMKCILKYGTKWNANYKKCPSCMGSCTCAVCVRRRQKEIEASS